MAGIFGHRYNEIKVEVVKSIIHLLDQDLLDPNYDAEQKESLIVAKQCLEAVYEIDAEKIEHAVNLIELFHLQNIPASKQRSEANDVEAERYKVLGNESMKHSKYDEAIENYTKACKMNPTNAIYFCNRAAAYSRLEKHHESVSDCKEAIKLDPTYGKAYGRLGIAYSNLKLYPDATDAYKKALQLDPTNITYQANLKLAEEKMTQLPILPPVLMNPALFSMATQMLSEPSFRDIINGIIPNITNPNMVNFGEMGQQLAEHMREMNPAGLASLQRETFGDSQADGGAHQNPSNETPQEPDESND